MRQFSNIMAGHIILLAVLLGSMTRAKAAGSPQAYSTNLESTLRTSLYTNYEILQRPSKNVEVKIDFNILTINSLDIKTQKLSTSGYFTMIWNDTRLYWANDSTYDNIEFLFSTETYQWRPAIIIENSVSELKVFSDTNTLIRVVSSGESFWSPGGVFETNCEADVTYYPLDTQECSITLSTWGYTSAEVSLVIGGERIVMDHFKENGEWEITSVTTSSSTSSRNSKSFSRLMYTFKLRRRPLFHILNTIFPVILMASLTIFVFKLPPESGERVGMSLTVLLAYAVYLTLISGNIPQTSLSASIISVYLTIILMLSALSVMFTIIVLDIYFNHEDDEDIPSWVQKLARNVLVKIAMWKGTRCCSNTPKYTTNSTPDAKVKQHQNGKVAPERLTSVKSATRRDAAKDTSKVTDFTEDPDDEEVKLYSWKEIALILDRCFMYLFIFFIVSATLICLLILCLNF